MSLRTGLAVWVVGALLVGCKDDGGGNGDKPPPTESDERDARVPAGRARVVDGQSSAAPTPVITPSS